MREILITNNSGSAHNGEQKKINEKIKKKWVYILKKKLNEYPSYNTLMEDPRTVYLFLIIFANQTRNPLDEFPYV